MGFKMIIQLPRRFVLMRYEDETGVSGTGPVAYGIRWHDGSCALHWNGEVRSTSIFKSIDEIRKIHGHNGKTEIVFHD